jgi:anti-sigma B factor antagonist
MLTCVAEARAVGEAVVPAQHEHERPASLKLSHQTSPTGETVVELRGELDMASADAAIGYVGAIIERRRGPVAVDLTDLAFCDARGLAALVRMAGCAEQRGCPFRLVSPRPSLVKIMRITGLDRRFLPSQASEPHR